MKTIVLARMIEDSRIKELGQVDIGRPHRWETFLRPEACIWLNKGTEEDLRKAQEYASREGYSVFVFEIEEPNPLEKARMEISGTKREVLSHIGRKGGLSTSEAKVSASRSNGKLGGRPKKTIVILD